MKITKEQKKFLDSIKNSKGMKINIKGIEENYGRKLNKSEKELYFLGFLEGGAYISKMIAQGLF